MKSKAQIVLDLDIALARQDLLILKLENDKEHLLQDFKSRTEVIEKTAMYHNAVLNKQRDLYDNLSQNVIAYVEHYKKNIGEVHTILYNALADAKYTKDEYDDKIKSLKEVLTKPLYTQSFYSIDEELHKLWTSIKDKTAEISEAMAENNKTLELYVALSDTGNGVEENI